MTFGSSFFFFFFKKGHFIHILWCMFRRDLWFQNHLVSVGTIINCVGMDRFNLLGGQSNFQGGQMPTQLTCYLPPWVQGSLCLTIEQQQNELELPISLVKYKEYTWMAWTGRVPGWHANHFCWPYPLGRGAQHACIVLTLSSTYVYPWFAKPFYRYENTHLLVEEQ